MRILAVVPLYPPNSRVGAWLSTHECLAYMATRGHQVDVVTLLGNHDPYVHDGITVTAARTVDIDTAIAGSDVVVSHLGDDQKTHRCAVARGVPSVRMVHGESGPGAAGLAGAALAVFNSHALARFIGWDGPQVIVHPPVDPAQWRTTPGDRITLVNLSREKGSELFYLLAASLPQLPFLGVQGGYGRQHIRRTRNVETIGPTRNMRVDVYARTRILLMPSERETWGRVAIEAMCSGIPVIAHPTDGLLESLGHAGIFVDRCDLGGWRREIFRLQDPDEWAAASRRALDRIAELDHTADLHRFAAAVEQLAGVPA